MIGTVFRVEHEDTGQGCYRQQYGGDFVDKMGNNHSNTLDIHPPPQKDIGIDRYSVDGEFCGFKDMKQLQKWFTNFELRELEKLGYIIMTIENAEITVIGEKQVLFHRPA